MLGEVALRIEHVGSTAIPGMAAKPVIDIQISVRSLEPMDVYAKPLEQLGYARMPHPDDAVYPFFHRPAGWPHTHHVHVCRAGGREERRHLAFRDYLRDHPEDAHRYELLKRDLATRYTAASFEARNAYSEAKTEFIVPREEAAMASGYPRNL